MHTQMMYSIFRRSHAVTLMLIQTAKENSYVWMRVALCTFISFFSYRPSISCPVSTF
jgi:hypothetical protein